MAAIVQAIRQLTAAALYRAAQVASPAAVKSLSKPLRSVDDGRGWFSLFSSFHRNFQTNDVEINRDSVFAQTTFFSCLTLIAGDIAKLRAKLVELVDGIWKETTSASFSPVLRKPNHYQTWQQFIECWIISKLGHGNTYVLKVRDKRGVVVALYVLEPTRCRPLVAETGAVFYALNEDDLSTVYTERTGVDALPASEIIHDRFNCLFHPLVGLSPLFASGLAATQALEISKHSASFWKNSGRPGGILTAPGDISDETAARAKEYFESNFTGENSGRVAVLADGLKFEAMSMKSVDAQLVEQLKLSAEQVCAPFHVPAYMVGSAPVPPNNNVEALNLAYYTQCLQALIEAIENTLDEGLGLHAPKDGKQLGVELDLRGLLRMDAKATVEVLTKASGGAYMKPDEARAEANLPPLIAGGDTLWKQHQDYPINLLANRLPPEADGGGSVGAVRSAYLTTKGFPDIDPIRELIVAEVKAAIAAVPKARDGADGKDGRDADPEFVRSEVRKAVADMPAPKDGRDGKDGSSVDPETVRSMVRAAVDEIPKPRDGVDGRNGMDGRDIGADTANELVAKHVEVRLPTLIAKALDDRLESVITKAALQVAPGRDGLPGRPGTPGDPGLDGRHGIDGKDGLGLDDFDVYMQPDGRTMVLSLKATDGRTITREMPVRNMPVYRGIFQSGQKGSKAGDCFTHSGSLWMALADTDTAPPGVDWQLCVKGHR